MDGLSARDRVELRELHQGRDRSQFTARLKELGFTKLGQRLKVEQALQAEEPAPAPEPEPLQAEPSAAEPPIVEPESAEPESPETAWRRGAAEPVLVPLPPTLRGLQFALQLFALPDKPRRRLVAALELCI